MTARPGKHLFDTDLVAVTRDLHQMELRDWWRFGIVLTIVLVLGAGVFMLAQSAVNQDPVERSEIRAAASGLLAVLLVFALFSLYQQVRIVELRRQVASQIGMIATLEMVRPNVPRKTPTQRRRYQRYYFDAVLSVAPSASSSTIYGRISDISEGGLGVVLAQPIGPETPVRLEIWLGEGHEKFTAHAITRYRRGFFHGLEFLHMTGAQRTQIKSICESASPIEYGFDRVGATSAATPS